MEKWRLREEGERRITKSRPKVVSFKRREARLLVEVKREEEKVFNKVVRGKVLLSECRRTKSKAGEGKSRFPFVENWAKTKGKRFSNRGLLSIGNRKKSRGAEGENKRRVRTIGPEFNRVEGTIRSAEGEIRLIPSSTKTPPLRFN